MPLPTPSIRTATTQDAEILSSIHRDAFPNYWNVAAFNDFFAVKDTFAFIASSCGEHSESTGSFGARDPAQSLRNSQDDVGMIVYRLHGGDADIMTMAVKPAFRRQGIARELLQKTLAHAATLGVGTMFLDVEEGNHPAISLYEKHGFTLIRRRKSYYRQKDGSLTDALVMAKKFA
jgi:[ribosomal protein S18]-alanine N-acetyltransferase